ncbi:threonine ammonia-lyase [Xanthobacter tagetidis]|uniref:Threonine ammonia-lyase n=1 Tax=Xanthobacter tagetidis TaxID=60216 RepID=A0A3L7ACC2_9HYPH|nr:threonine ammonia-lyase [Xanthobacter tagetidis]MBB6309844.1 threonine dehydratase [Xanthobacter tagetidis]RLP78136.1 threonine ammonia-lyase [Xanthobacter tagetidis]
MSVKVAAEAGLPVTLADVEAARPLLAGAILRTPTLRAPRLSALTGADVWVKYENFQVTASFKERGALVKLARLSPEEARRGVVAMSAGNHAQAVACHGTRLGISTTIVMPETTPQVKVMATEAFGAHVVLHGDTVADAQGEAERISREEGRVFVHPYDDRDVIAGQGSIGLEMIEDGPQFDAVLAPIGGGGLASGVALAFAGRSPQTEIVGVEAALYPAMWSALTGIARPCGGPTLAEGIAVHNVGALTRTIIRALVPSIVLVDETALERAVNAFLTNQKTLAEGAGAAGLAALLTEPERFAGRTVGLILCGGNIDPRMLAGIILRELEREERIVSFRLTILDRPGMLGRIATLLGKLGANILEVHHRRTFLDVPAKGTRLDLTVETRDQAHAQAIEAALEAEGLPVQRLGAGGIDW